jgi:hypothetical protein
VFAAFFMDCQACQGHCCVGRKSDTTPAPREALRVGKYTIGVYSTLDKSPIRRLAAARKVPRRRNATVPSVLFYSNQDGAGYHMRYQLTLPTDPPPTPKPGRSYNFELHPAFWFGLAMCDTQSFPEQMSTCKPHSDSNITTDPTQHPGTAFMEMQLYPPGWAGWDTVGTSCDPTKWCAALNIDSLSQNPINEKQLTGSARRKLASST